MKVLFAVSNEEISESIVKKYQKEYKQIISYKNVYYFNAILKELQKDKTYDRVVISEDLEAFTHTQYDQIDKFIFEKMDSISDEASNVKGNDTPIIVICADRRTKGEQMLVKLFGIGIYNAIIGNDRSVDEVCRLINRPRTKKEAKTYYKIDTEDVSYQAENENDVSEMEIQNIVAHYKRLGKNEDRYIDSFNNIAAQYNDTQLRIITKFLPLNVRAVLEEKSQKYQQIMSFNNSVADSLRKNKNDEEGPSQILLKSKQRDNVLSKPVVIPSAVDMHGVKKLAKQKTTYQPQPRQVQPQPVNPEPIVEGLDDFEDFEPVQAVQEQAPVRQPEPVQQTIESMMETQAIPEPVVQQEVPKPAAKQPISPIPEPIIEGLEELVAEPKQEATKTPEVETPVEAVQPVKRGRGRPRKNPVPVVDPNKPKRGRGRPRKNPVPEAQEEVIMPTTEQPNLQNVPEPESIDNMVLPGLEPEPQVTSTPEPIKQELEDTFLPGFTEFEVEEPVRPVEKVETTTEQEAFLPGFEAEEEQEKEDVTLPGFESFEEPIMPEATMPRPDPVVTNNYDYSNNYNNDFVPNRNKIIDQEPKEHYEEIDLSNLLTPDKKIVTFVGTSKNGTSFIVNNVAQLLSSVGINVAILDTTQNRNSYYIYTKNEEPLREIATHSIERLTQGVASGISVNKNLTVYTSLPDDEGNINHVDKILETLLQKHSLILIDTDFKTPLGYFKQSQETYLVQSMDILTIQPLTAFLKELKVKNILDEKKLRIILNKVVKIRGIKDATIIGGIAFYNDPAMSFMTELFDRDRIKYVSMPFEEETYIKYLEGIIECEISLKGYSKVFLQTLRELGNMIYPIVTSAQPRNNKNYQPPTARGNGEAGFSSSMNDTLNKMRGY